MSLKCTACGFESPDGSTWCEFCKEPFKKRGAAAAVEEMKKLSPEERLRRLPDELRKDAARETPLPTLPPWFRPLSYVFIAVLAVLLTILGIMASSRAREAAPPPQRFGSP